MWVNNSGDYITNTQFLDCDMPADFDAWTIPSCWKISPLINNGYPYISLMIDLSRLELNPVKQYDYICIFCPRTVSGSTIYPEQNELLNGNGDAILTPTSCEITEERNGMWSLSMQHPIDNEKRYQYININSIIRAMGQLFTVKKVDEVWNGNSGSISVYAEHIFYQLNDVWIYPRDYILGVSGYFSLYAIMHAYSEEEREGSMHYAFSWSSNITYTDSMWIMYLDSGATPIECILGGSGLIEMKGGELYRNNFYFSVNTRMENAKDNAFDIRVGHNLSGIQRTVDMSNMVSYFRGYDPYGAWLAWAWNFSSFFGDIFPHYVIRSENFDFPKAAESEDWDYDAWFNGTFNDTVLAFLLKNGKPIICYEIDIEDTRRNPDFDFIATDTVDSLRVGDKGRLYDVRMGGEITIEITQTVYDAVHQKCKKVTVGDKQSFVTTSMPSYTFDIQPVLTGGEATEIDADGNQIQDANGDDIIIEIHVEV